MQAFDDLKQDIQTLIDTASSTITQLVDQAARNAAAAVPSTSGTDTADVFNSQLSELSSKVRAATENLRQQAAAVLNSGGSADFGPGSFGGGSSGSGSTGGISPANPSGEPIAEEQSIEQARSVGPDSFKAAN